MPGALTDDRGRFRLARVEPGTYVVAVPSTNTTVPVSVIGSIDAYTLRTELSRAGLGEQPALGHPRTQQIGDVALVTMASVPTPPPPSPDGRLQMYRTTYYPAATTAADAETVRLEGGEERTGLTISLRPVPTSRISGRLVTPDGSVR